MTSNEKVFHSKRTNEKMKRQPTEWEKLVNDTSDQGLISKIYKEFIQIDTKIKKSHLKMGRGPTQTFLQRGHTDGQSTYEKMFNITNH